MPSVGEISIDKNNFSNIINNSTEAAGGITQGVANESELLGELLVYVLIGVLIGIVISVFVGIIFLVLSAINKMPKAVKMQ